MSFLTQTVREKIQTELSRRGVLLGEPRPDWLSLARDEQLRPEGCDTFVLIGGRGCVAGETLLFDPVKGSHERFDVLATRGEPVHVLTKEGIVECEAPFLKGVATLYRVVYREVGGYTARMIVVTDEHLCLSDGEWVPLVGGGAIEGETGMYKVEMVTELGEGPYYDIHVPGPNHYLAQGIWHHNSGKTRSGAEDLLQRVRDGVKRCHILAPTFADCRDVCVEGESGILACAKPGEVANWNRSMGELSFTNGAKLKCFAAVEPDRLNGPQCFVAGTLVRGDGVDIPIEEVKIGDMALTRKGLQRVYRTTHSAKAVGTVAFSDGTKLTGTADHLVYTVNRGWTRMDHLQEGDSVCAISALNGAAKGGIATDRDTTNIAARDQRIAPTGTGYTGLFGDTITVIFRRAMTCITWMATSATTPLITLRFSRERSIHQGTSWTRLANTFTSLCLRSSRYAQRAELAWNVSGTPWLWNAPGAGNEKRSRSASKKPFVNNAGKLSGRVKDTTAPSVASTWQHEGERSVYCLSVANAPEFYANGVLVHNCGHLWGDEFGLYGNSEAIDMALFGLRLGDRVTSCWTSTPKMTKSTKYVLALERAFIKRMRMRDNLMNLAPGVVEQLERKYGGTRLGQQELDGEILEDVAGALWKPEWFRRDGFRLPLALGKSGGQLLFDPPKQIIQTVVALDPSVSDPERKRNPHKDPDACGIVVAGIDEIGRGYVLADMTAVMAPADWARTAVSLYTMCRCSKIVAESNQGGALISEVIKGVSSNVPVELVTASMGKRPRAEPVAVLYEQGRVSHCGSMNDLEDQMLTWDASDPSQPSPNNVDALVWAFHGLGLCNATGSKISSGIKSYGT